MAGPAVDCRSGKGTELDGRCNFVIDGGSAAYQFDSFEFLDPYFRGLRDAGVPSYGYETDCPDEYFYFGGSSAAVEATALRNKIQAYERWLHGIGQHHILICNQQLPQTQDQAAVDGGALLQSTWDHDYSDLQVRAGSSGSWAGAGLYNATPEGAQVLEATVHPGGTVSYQIAMKNAGNVEALPMLVATESGGPDFAFGATLLSPSGRVDVGYDMEKGEGFVPLELLPAGDALILQISVSASPSAIPGEQRKIVFNGYWNPQDSTEIVHDAVGLSVVVK